MAASDERLSSIATEQPVKELAEIEEALKRVIALGKEAQNIEITLKGATNLKDTVTASTALVTVNEKLATSYQGLAKVAEFYVDWKARSNGSTDKEIAGTGKVLKLKVEEEKARAAAAKAMEAENKAKLAGLKVDREREGQARKTTTTQQQEAKAIKDITDERKLLNLALRDAEVRYANLYLTQGKGNALTVQAKNDVLAIRKTMDELNHSIGRYGDNVGNYAGKFNSLGFSIRNIAGELPNAGISFRTFAQSISNNIGPLSDAIAEVRVQNAALAAEGKPTVSVGKQIASSIFSWQTGILALVAAFTYFAPKLVDWIFNTDKAEAAAKKAEEAIKKEADAQKELTDAQANSIGGLKTLYEITQNTALSQKARTDAVKELQKEYPAYFANMSTESILAGKATQAYLDLTDALLAKSRAQVFQSRYNEALSKEIDIAEKINQKTRERNKLGNVGGVTTNGKGVDTITFDATGNESKAVELNQELAELEKERSENGRKMQGYMEEITKNTITQLDLTKEVEKEKKEKKPKKEEDEMKEILRITRARYETLSAINKASVDNDKLSLQERLIALDKFSLDEISIVKLTGAINGDTTEEIQAKITELVYKYAKLRTDIIEQEGKQQKKFEEDNLKALQNGVGNGGSRSRKEFEKEQASRRENLQIYAESAIKTQQAIGDLNSQITARRIKEIDEEIEALNRRTQTEIDGINASSLSAEEKEKKIADAKARGDAQAKVLEQDKIARMRRAAQFEKSINIASIIANTALAVIKAWTEGDPYTKIARSIAAGAAGAAQLAVAIAAPLPAYEDGTQGKAHPGGPARLFEGNKTEAVWEDGKWWAGDKEGVYNLSKGAQVVSNKELLEMSRYYTLGIPALRTQQGQTIDLSGIKDGLAKVEQAISSKPVAQLNVTGMGMQRLTRQANSITEYINSFSA